MSNNKHILNIESTILDNKIVQLSNKLTELSQSNENKTQEDLIAEATKFLSTFFGQLAEPIFRPTEVISNHKPNLIDYNKDFTDILYDLRIIFSELENIETIILAHFNFIISNSNKTLASLKQVFSKLGDYILFSKDLTKDSIFYSDSFNNISRIDFNSNLINSTQCDIDQVQGIVTLPRDTSVTNTSILVTESPVVNSSSNGTPGNEIEDPSGLSKDIGRILDNNPDTWFEYERLLDQDDGVPLILDIVINLTNSQIINQIRINPNNFGTKNQITIDTIETSIDGRSFLSIKDEIPLNGFISQDEENIFVLAPSSSKFSGQGIYTFNPRNAKYLHLVFKQFTPYSIRDNSQTKIRYAIGIRDIEISSIKYLPDGEIVSVNYDNDIVFNKAALITNQNPVSASPLASINHYLSIDNGASWNQIKPEEFLSEDSIPNILNFNTSDTNSITTPASVKAIKYKAIFKRNKDAFSSKTSTKTNKKERVIELQRIPNQTPFDIILKSQPIDSNLTVLDPAFGSRGIDNLKYTIGIGTGNKIEFDLPFINIKKDIDKSIPGQINFLNPERVSINGETWTRDFLVNQSPDSKVYELDYLTGKLKFGDGTTGKAVPLGSRIEIKFTPERLFIVSNNRKSEPLIFPSSRDRKSIKIRRQVARTNFSELLHKNATVHQLANKNINSIAFSDTTIFASQQAFVNGNTELTSDGQWSLDNANGIIYSKSSTSSNVDTTVFYNYTPEIILNESDWEFDENSIVIADKFFTTISVTGEDVPSGTKYFSVNQFSLLKGSVSFSDTSIFQKEVPYINGKLELTSNIKTTETISQILTNGNIKNFILKMPIVTDSTYDVTFSESDLFQSRVFSIGEVDSIGKYFVDLSTRIIYIYTATNPVGTVSYYYQNQSKRIDGLYSINYITGEIFTSVATQTGTTISYQYSHFEIDYPIARKIDNNDFTFDATTNTITIDQREILKRQNINNIGSSTQSPFYQIIFDKDASASSEDIATLEPYFTPILKDYAIKIIPGSALIF